MDQIEATALISINQARSEPPKLHIPRPTPSAAVPEQHFSAKCQNGTSVFSGTRTRRKFLNGVNQTQYIRASDVYTPPSPEMACVFGARDTLETSLLDRQNMMPRRMTRPAAGANDQNPPHLGLEKKPNGYRSSHPATVLLRTAATHLRKNTRKAAVTSEGLLYRLYIYPQYILQYNTQ